jgi:mitofilin
MPDVKLGRSWGGMTTEELNSLIAHAHRRIEQLQKQLAEQQALEKLRMQTSLDKKQEEDEKIADGRVGREQEKLLAEFDIEKQKLGIESGIRFEQELRHQLARQAAAHSDHLADVLNVQERELFRKYETLLDENLLHARHKFREDLKNHIHRMHGIEAAIEGRAEMEKQGRKAQELWLACQTLYNVILTGHESEVAERRLKPLAGDLQAIKEAGNNHPYVNTVIESFPQEAAEKGVWTHEALLERFSKVRRICKRVAMVDETGATLFRYFLSYLQSLLVFSKSSPLTESDEVDLDNLSTFMILQQASYCMERGDLEQALRYMNQLKGESRNVAQDWINDTRLLLEARQAADALLGHASASGLGSLF